MHKEKSKRTQANGQALVIGFLLLIPLIFISTMTHLIPTVNVFATAQTSSNMLRDSEYIGMENYERIAEDQRFQESLGNTLEYVVLRMLIAAIVPALIGGLIGIQARIGRLINRLVLSLITVFIVPISMGILWRLYLSPNWGRDPSPIFNEDMSLATVEGAKYSLQTLDAFLITAIAAVIGGTIFIAVMRGRNKLMAGIGVGIIGVIIAGASGFLVFDLPYAITNGGPGNATTTYMLSVFQSGFMQFRMGLASAQVSLLAIGAVIVGLVIGLVTIAFNLRLVPIHHSGRDEGNNLVSIASIPLLLLVLMSLAGLVMWGMGLTPLSEGSDINERMDWGRATINSMMPWLAIWLVQLPITFMAGLALGFFRPFGKIGSNILFVVLFTISIIPMEVMMFEWFQMAREMELLNQTLVLGVPWLVNGFALLVFKLLFDGAYDNYHNALDDGMSTQKAFTNRVMLPGILTALVLGVLMSFISSQSMLWSLISQNSMENFTSVVALVQMQAQMAMDTSAVANTANQLIFSNFLIFLVLFGLMQVFILDRFTIEAGNETSASTVMYSDNYVDDSAYDDDMYDDDTYGDDSDSYSDSSSDGGGDSGSDGD